MGNIKCSNDSLIKAIQESVESKLIKADSGKEYIVCGGNVNFVPSAEENALNIEINMRRARIKSEQEIKNLLREEEERKIPEPRVIEVNSLVGILDFLRQYQLEEFTVPPAIIHVVNYNEVSVRSKLLKSGQRITFCTAACHNILKDTFESGKFYGQEQMIINLQSLFVKTPETDALLGVIGKTTDITSRDFNDDGYSQGVAVKAGIASTSEVKLPNPVTLQPYRTFHEIEQPKSIFIARTRKMQSGPEFSLFQADGGLWKLLAIDSIKNFFKDHEVGLPIIG